MFATALTYLISRPYIPLFPLRY